MKKFLIFLCLFLFACTNSFQEDFGTKEKLNTWANEISLKNLCSALDDYRNDRIVSNRILIEFNRRNVSYMECEQYK